MGPLAAILIGMGLVPLRGFTVASNFTLAFVVLTIVVAEFGGGRAAFATAMASTLSLDFFLTEPNLRLTIASKHDAIAFSAAGRPRGGLRLLGVLPRSGASTRSRLPSPTPCRHPRIGRIRAARLATPRRRDAERGAPFPRWRSGTRGARSWRPRDVAVPPQKYILDILAARDLLVLEPTPQRITPDGTRIPLTAGTRAVCHRRAHCASGS